MATESPVRMTESGGVTNWKPPKGKGVSSFASQLHNSDNNMALDEELEALLSDQRNMAPNRSGSAPPSIEGSFAAYTNLMAHQTSNLKSSIPGFGNSVENLESEEQMRADPAYIAYYYSNVNLNPRLPPPITRLGVTRGSKTGGGGEGSGHFDRNSLSPHNEEPEDDKSDNCSETENIVTPGYDAASLAAHHKSLVDLIQEDFPRTPSPLYNHTTTLDEGISHDVQSISLENLVLNASKLSDSSSGSVNTRVKMKTEGENPYGSTSKEEEGPLLIGSNPDTVADAPGVVTSRNLLIAIPGSLQDVQSRNENTALQPGVAYQVQHGAQNHHRVALQLGTQDIGGQSKISQQQHYLQPPPIFATAAAYMTTTTSGDLPPFSPGGSHFAASAPPPQYGGYTLNSPFIPPFVPGYSSVGVHMQYDPLPPPPAAASFPSGEAIPHAAGDLLQQHVNKFYGRQQQMHPSFPDPHQMQLQMQYFQQQSVGQDPYGTSQYGWFASMNAPSSIASYRGSCSSNDHMFLPAANVRNSSGSGSYYGSAPMTQFWPSPFGSPIMPASPVAVVGSNTLLGRRNDFRLGQSGSDRNLGIYDTGWQGQRGVDSLGDYSQKKHSILDELKSCAARKIDLFDLSGRVIEFSIDQHGSRFIQQKLENCKVEERESVFREILPHAPKLMTDVFGNYVVQKFFEHGSHVQRKQLADQLSGQILPLTLQMYGCRVIQKALEVIELDQKIELVSELDGHVLRCVRDQNGNHVIQKCIECIPTEKIGFIISSFQGQVATLSTHPYGCRVIQRVLEHCGDELQSQCIVDEILESAHILVLDQYGNYVTQHVLRRGKPHERSKIISKLSGRIVQMSQHKYASNVVEKCLEHGDVAERERLIEEILGQSEENNNLLTMMKDQFANYVVQKILEISNEKQREVLLHRINVNIQALKKYTYGKHIVARFEQLCGEECEGSG